MEGRAAIFNLCAMAHWCTTKGPQVRSQSVEHSGGKLLKKLSLCRNEWMITRKPAERQIGAAVAFLQGGHNAEFYRSLSPSPSEPSALGELAWKLWSLRCKWLWRDTLHRSSGTSKALCSPSPLIGMLLGNIIWLEYVAATQAQFGPEWQSSPPFLSVWD